MRSEELLHEILEQLKSTNRDNRLWSAKDIAEYLGIAVGSVQNRIICKFDFPPSVSIKTEKGRTNRRWYPEEVKEWIRKQRSTRKI